jgi:hypothetical protein
MTTNNDSDSDSDNNFTNVEMVTDKQMRDYLVGFNASEATIEYAIGVVNDILNQRRNKKQFFHWQRYTIFLQLDNFATQLDHILNHREQFIDKRIFIDKETGVRISLQERFKRNVGVAFGIKSETIIIDN